MVNGIQFGKGFKPGLCAAALSDGMGKLQGVFMLQRFFRRLFHRHKWHQNGDRRRSIDAREQDHGRHLDRGAPRAFDRFVWWLFLKREKKSRSPGDRSDDSYFLNVPRRKDDRD